MDWSGDWKENANAAGAQFKSYTRDFKEFSNHQSHFNRCVRAQYELYSRGTVNSEQWVLAGAKANKELCKKYNDQFECKIIS